MLAKTKFKEFLTALPRSNVVLDVGHKAVMVGLQVATEAQADMEVAMERLEINMEANEVDMTEVLQAAMADLRVDMVVSHSMVVTRAMVIHREGMVLREAMAIETREEDTEIQQGQMLIILNTLDKTVGMMTQTSRANIVVPFVDSYALSKY